uniref:FLYWCH-type domain-containing protein n=1 Tax=Graphocephala atropunctata TaxID=36148 RepID=A0A1B6LCH9_9HEMI
MGRPDDQLSSSEALPGIGDHHLVFHNGKGFYYVCKEFSTCFYKREFECVKAECGVTATMGPDQGSPLQDNGTHTHPPDWDYRDKCLMLHTIRQRFLAEDTNPALILQEVILNFHMEDDTMVLSEELTFEDSVQCEVSSQSQNISEVEEDSCQNQSEVISEISETEDEQEEQGQEPPITKLNVIPAFQYRTREQKLTQPIILKRPERKKPQPQRKRARINPIPACYEVYHENDIPSEVLCDVSPSEMEDDTHEDLDVDDDDNIKELIQKTPRKRLAITDSQGYMYTISKSTTNITYLRCSRTKSNGCRATGIMKKDGKVIPSSNCPHNHRPNPRLLMVRKFVVATLDEVEKEAKKPEEQIRPFRDIYREMLARYPKYAPYVTYKMIRRSIKRTKVLY